MASDDDHLLLAVGQALKQWSAVETSIATLFAILCEFKDEMKAHRIIDAIISFETRLDVADALMSQEDLTPLELETWKRLVAKLKKQYKKRHEVAHFSIVNTITNSVGTLRLSPFLTYGHFARDELRYLTENEIHARRKGFADLFLALVWFQDGAYRRRGPRPGNPMQEPPLIAHLRELAVQILEERARKQQAIPRTQLLEYPEKPK